MKRVMRYILIEATRIAAGAVSFSMRSTRQALRYTLVVAAAVVHSLFITAARIASFFSSKNVSRAFRRTLAVAATAAHLLYVAIVAMAGFLYKIARRALRRTLIVAYILAGLLAMAGRGIKKVLSILVRGINWFLSLRGIKRALSLALIVAIVVIGFLSVRGAMPFMAIYGTSMEPVFHSGDLILIEDMPSDEIEVGDVIVFTIPPMVREVYNYPPVVAHRVIQVEASEMGTTFRTKGDNTGEDPFTVRTEDLKGQVSGQIPYLGFPLLFLQSDYGLVFVIIALSLLTLYLYSDELNWGRQKMQKGVFAPVIEETQRTSRMLERRIGTTEKGMASTEQALNKFAAAIELYAEHLKSHTGAIQGLSEASQELKKGAAEQNKVLARLLENIEQKEPEREKAEPEEKETEPRIKGPFPPGCVRSRRQSAEDEDALQAG
jgi:signal peptidase I